MTAVHTVLGPLAPWLARRGPVLAHEHLVLDLSRPDDRAAVLDTDRDAPAVVRELTSLREEFSLALVIELTCRGMGRDIAALARISRASGVPVVAATGWYHQGFHPPEVAGAGVEQLTGTLVREITEGADGTGIRPGVIGEIGTGGAQPTEAEARVLRAAAGAALATGLSVVTHARRGQGGRAQLDLLTGAGLPPYRVCLGHQDLLDDPAAHRALAAEGAYVAFDTIGKARYRPDADRLRLLLALLEAGHAHRVLLSGDVSRRAYLQAAGGPGYGHLLRGFLDQVRAAGVDEPLIDLMTRRNPLRFLTGTEAEA
ncbi:phosphotriesterase family protein [Streptomyces antimicrobicus]|uniref:Phosphotriesterase n=1 Tax=Streptomyces antimicrobicus TaxID=2883108 RepID=A0ABS8BBW5_9ACTN|nr:phosphotriesterase [Streptomyces antimicrobicus]MCB5182119.1 phosphotriesterase [Streptomyces antimicrobicus]